MAAAKKQTGTKAKTTGKRTRKTTTASKTRNSVTKTHQRKIQDVNDYKDKMAFETGVTIIVLMIMSLFLYISFMGLGGVVGRVFGGVAFGVFGWITWLLPISVLVGYTFFIVNRGDRRVPRKLISLTIGSFLLLGITDLMSGAEIITEFYTSNHVLHHSYFECMNLTLEDVLKSGKASGGLIGRFIDVIFTNILGKVGAGVLMIALLFLCVYIFYGIELMGAIRKRNAYRKEMENIYHEVKDDEDYEEPSYNVMPKHRHRRPVQRSNDMPMQAVNLRKMNSHLDNTAKQSLRTSSAAKAKTQQVTQTSQTAQTSQMEEIVSEVPQKVESIEPEEQVELQQARNEDIPIYREEMQQKFHKSSTTPRKKTSETEINEQMTPAVSMQETEATEIPEQVSSKPMASFAHKKEVTDVTPSKTSPKTKSESTYKKPEKIADHSKIGGEDYVSQSATFNALNDSKVEVEEKDYQFPPINLLSEPKHSDSGMSDSQLRLTASKLQDTLRSFNVNVQMGAVTCGPTVTRYELLPEQGVRVNKITNLTDDLKLSLAAPSIRIEAPIPGKSAVGIEVPNPTPSAVYFRELLDGQAFAKSKSPVTFAVGKDIGGQLIMTDISKMPHLLIAGATGSGKSVCINTLIMSILYKANPNDVKLIMIDPKVVELSVYNGIPHLFCPVVTDPKEAAAALNWAVREMNDRYNKFKELGVRNIAGYNEKIKTVPNPENAGYSKMPFLVIIVDEFADLMMVASKDVEDSVCRLAQLARAAGIHLVLATQRPSVNVITGVIKANIPSRIAFSVSSAIDSRTILDKGGAEKLLGKGDMLFFPSGYSEPVRVQGAFVSDMEVSNVVDFLCNNNEKPEYNDKVTEIVESASSSDDNTEKESKSDRDEYFEDAGRFVIESERAAAGQLQRRFSIGFNRAGRIIDQLNKAGVVGPAEGTKPRKILMTAEQFEMLLGNGVEPVSDEELDAIARDFADETAPTLQQMAE